MSVGYDIAPDKVTKVVNKVLHDYHGELEAADVTIQVLFAHKYDNDGEPEPTMKTRGQVVLAKIAITNLQDRTRGIPDAKLVIDRSFGWDQLTDTRRVALVDHELTHLQLTLDKVGNVKKDDRGRPKLHMRHHDWELTGFAEVCERHGEAAVEVREIVLWQETYGQYALFPLQGTDQTTVKVTQ